MRVVVVVGQMVCAGLLLWLLLAFLAAELFSP